MFSPRCGAGRAVLSQYLGFFQDTPPFTFFVFSVKNLRFLLPFSFHRRPRSYLVGWQTDEFNSVDSSDLDATPHLFVTPLAKFLPGLFFPYFIFGGITPFEKVFFIFGHYDPRFGHK